MACNSKRKGARGELEFVKVCKVEGFDNVRRGQQYCGANGDADVVGLEGVHIEVKRIKRNLNLEDAMVQAKSDARKGEIPIVAHRKDNCKWKITMDAEDWFKLYREWV